MQLAEVENLKRDAIQWCGLHLSPPNYFAEAFIPVPWNVTIFGDQTFTDTGRMLLVQVDCSNAELDCSNEETVWISDPEDVCTQREDHVRKKAPIYELKQKTFWNLGLGLPASRIVRSKFLFLSFFDSVILLQWPRNKYIQACICLLDPSSQRLLFV